MIAGTKEEQSERRIYTFAATEPLRYLAFIVSKFVRSEPVTVRLGDSSLAIAAEANPRQVKRGQALGERATDIARFYASLIGRRAVPGLHARGRRGRSARRPQPRRTSRSSSSRCRPRRSRGATIRRLSRTFRISSSRTSSRTSGGDRRSAGATTTSSG